MELLLASPELAGTVAQLVVQFPALVVLVYLVHRSDSRLGVLNENLSESRREEAAIHATILGALSAASLREVPHA